MTDSRILPGARARLVDANGVTSREFYDFFRRLQESGVSEDQIRELAIKLGSPDGTIANIPDNPAGIQSIIGLAPITAAGNTVSLAPLVPTVGGSLVGVTLDGFGRVSQTRPVVAGTGITIDDTTDPAQIELIASGLTNPMTTLGDIITGDTGGTPKRLPIGTSGQVLTVVSGEPAWAAGGGGGSLNVQDEGTTVVTGATALNFVGTGVTATNGGGGVATVTIPGGLSNPMTTSGDIITGGASGVPQRLAAGANDTVLTISAGVPAWAPAPGTGYVDPGVQPWGYIIANVAGSGFTSVGGLGITVTGTAAARTVTGASIVSSLPRSAATAASAATAVCGLRVNTATIFCLGASSGIGGFNVKHRVIVGDGAPTASHRFFSGLINSTAAPTDVNPSTLVNIIGIGYDSADTQLQIMHNDGAGAATKIALGASFPKPTVALANAYDLELSTVGGSGVVSYIVTDVISGATASGTISTDLPAGATMLTFLEYLSAGGTATAVSLESSFWYYRLGKPRP